MNEIPSKVIARSNAIVRPWTISDIPSILSIQSSAPGASLWDRSAYENIFEIAAPNYGCVAEIGHRIVGFACYRVIAPDSELLNLAVDSSFHRIGIGRKILEHVRLASANLRASVMYLEVRESNLPAIRLYAKAGFEEIGRRKAYYTEPVEDAITFRMMM